VRVIGDGIAALVVARLLLRSGWAVCLEAPPRRGASPDLVVDTRTARLLCDVLGAAEAVWEGSHPLRGRHVRWHPLDPGVEVPAPAIVAPQTQLVTRLLSELTGASDSRLTVTRDGLGASGSPPWVVDASGGQGSGTAGRRRFGTRRMLAARATLRAGVDLSLACIEATGEGWVFMSPLGGGLACVQATVVDVAPEPTRQLESLIAGTHEIRVRLTTPVAGVAAFETAPSIAEEVCRPGWMAIGERAMAVDPICGDGVGYAVRGAILGAAVLDAIARGEDVAACLAHFRARLEVAFADHLKACHAFYSRVGFRRAWDSELGATRRGLADLEAASAARPAFRLGLRGFTLEPLERVTPS
jgi:hypothetical protein